MGHATEASGQGRAEAGKSREQQQWCRKGGWVCGAAQSSAAQRSTPYAGQDLMEVGGMEGNGWNGWMEDGCGSRGGR